MTGLFFRSPGPFVTFLSHEYCSKVHSLGEKGFGGKIYLFPNIREPEGKFLQTIYDRLLSHKTGQTPPLLSCGGEGRYGYLKAIAS
jgi:hypothetical protein